MPPVWLIGFLALSWWLGGLTGSMGFASWVGWVAIALIAAAVAIFAVAVLEFRRVKTTIIPREAPSALITSGIFSRSRNPIYLADTLLLAGLIVKWDALLAVPLIPAFVWIIQSRFIKGEEAGLDAAFPSDFAAYKSRTRRWI